MKCELMHKNLSVAQLEIDDATATILNVDNVVARNHLPFGIYTEKFGINRGALNSWWKSRSIPASREGIEEALETMGVCSPQALLTRCYGLSLSDHYWIKPQGSSLNWKDINFFENDFSEDIGNILLGEANSNNNLNFNSPDNTSDGNLKKRWKIVDGKRCLFKAGSAPFYQEPINEVVASCIMEKLSIPHIPYTIAWKDGLPFSVCENFLTPDTEMVSAWSIMLYRKEYNHENDYLHYINCCKELGVPDIEHSLDKMIVLDYIIQNEDRHFRNFGVVRNAETLEYLGASPIFDSGNSLCYNKTIQRMYVDTISCKPFKKKHNEQVRLVSSFDWIDFSKLNEANEEVKNILFEGNVIELIGENRALSLCALVEQRIESLEKKVRLNNKTISVTPPKNGAGDVEHK